ncbi:MAG: hypothetical protein Q7R79_02980 [bacterium]|nr:hypothetical protein [bacterium]
MTRTELKKFAPHIALTLGGLCIVAGLFVLVSFEKKNTTDIERIQRALSVKNALSLYYTYHASYPPAPNGAHPLGMQDTLCLSDSGFVSVRSDACAKKAYLYPTPPSLNYIPLEEDGQTPCTSQSACPHYAVHFNLDTNLLYPKGKHALTDRGIQ